MAFFKFRFGRSSKDQAAPAGPAESVEALRRRARHRLIGAAILVLLGVVGFPLLFDTQPRPVAVDIPIEIPDKAKAKPLAMPEAAPAAPAATASGGPVAEPVAPQAAAPAPAPAPAPAVTAAPPVAATPAPAPAAAPAPKAVAKAETKTAEPRKSDDGARAQALLEGKAPAKAAPGTEKAAEGSRFIVQVGAFSDNAKAREAQRKLERAGLKNYVHVVDKDGQKITRVRAGPFATRAEADKAANTIKGLDLPAAILTLG
ncbi:SPOR domain-containing protein [Variovorax sp. VNK109]|uniref:SPOR domain-containing protein n=1 Tax=Variovorax sp. VNK109 TaxID=3400919 RepID=UPI003C0B65EC